MHFLPDLTLVLCNWRVIVEPSPVLGKSCSMAHNVTCSPSITDREVVLKPTLVAMEYIKRINNHKLLLYYLSLLLLLFCPIAGFLADIKFSRFRAIVTSSYVLLLSVIMVILAQGLALPNVYCFLIQNRTCSNDHLFWIGFFIVVDIIVNSLIVRIGSGIVVWYCLWGWHYSLDP